MYPQYDPVDVAFERLFLELPTQWKRYDFHAMSDAERRAAAMLVHSGAAELRIRCKVESPSTRQVLRGTAVVSGAYMTPSSRGQVLMAELKAAARCLKGWDDVPTGLVHWIKTALRITTRGERKRMDHRAGVPGALWSGPVEVPGQVYFERLRIFRPPADTSTKTQTSPQAVAVASIGNVVVHVPPPTVVVANAEQDSRERRDDKEEHRPLLQVAKWSDLAIGIDGQWDFWAATPPPHHGEPFRKTDANQLSLPGDRWRVILEELAGSPSGDSAELVIILSRLGYLAPPSSLAGDGRARPGRVEAQWRAELGRTMSPIRRRLLSTLRDLSRELRAQVGGPKGRYENPLRIEDDSVRSRFVVGCLLPDRDGHLFFGQSRG